MHIASIGIDLGKNTFHLVALGERNKILLRKKLSRAQLLAYTANVPTSLVGLEACSGAHFLGARPREQGHEVRLIPAQFIKPYRKSNKNDFIDAEAIAEAVGKENMRFVPIVVPRQYSTGGKQKLLGISKRGNLYLRRMLIHGARAALFRIRYDTAGFGQWVHRLAQRAPRNKVVVAIANKLARIAWAVLSSGQDYRHPPLQMAA